ncbi:MAG TPA: TPM domain-containing protein [Allosphingosinicella sp.]|nr:TPM domain-containing protein [Allosphingosinicella sp.]
MKALALALLLSGSAACDAQAPAGNAQVSRLAAADAGARPLPALTGRVVDQADILPAGAEAELGARLEALEKATTDQLVVVTWPSLGDESIEGLGRRLGNGWGIGRADVDNGVMVIVAPSDRQTRIAVGEGLEGLLTDELAKGIIERLMIPKFRRGDYAEGVRAGTAGIEEVLRKDPKRPQRIRRSA